MRRWNLSSKDPLSLTLAADSRLNILDFANDQIWELLIGGGEPQSIQLQTSYGLRTRNMRIFPHFEEAHKIIRNPSDFSIPPVISQFAPNFIKLEGSPFPGIDVIFEYWVPDCQTIAGRIQIKNSSTLNRNIKFSVSALLNPIDTSGQPMIPQKIEVANVLAGKSNNLSPVLFITGGASSEASPYPGLTHRMSLTAGQSRRFTWVLASQPETEQSFRQARLTASQNFDSQISQIEMLAAKQMEIFTGNPDWDLAFAMGKKTALGLLHSRNKYLKHSSFVSARLPDQGYSPGGSGADYNHLWNGQSALESWYLLQYLLPEHPEVAKGLILNFIESQQENGFIDFKLGLAGQKSRVLAAPFLVSSTWEIYQATLDLKFIKKVFDGLIKFSQAWFDPSKDRDGDGIPEWNSAIQSGFDENPSFSPWLEGSQGADISLVESPDLCSYLFRELGLLIKMAKLLERQEEIPQLEERSEKLAHAVQSSWNSRRASYQYRDRETHQTNKGELLIKQNGSGKFPLNVKFDQDARLILQLETKESLSPPVTLTIRGVGDAGKKITKKYGPDSFTWLQNRSTLMLTELFSAVDQVEIKGLSEYEKFSLSVINHTLEDHTLLTPIWAGIPNPDQVDQLVRRKLSPNKPFLRQNGIPACPKTGKKENPGSGDYIWLPWNVFIGEGLLNYGKQRLVVEIITGVMGAIIQNLKAEQAFRSNYHAELPKASGQRGALVGLPPVGLFLKTLGVRPISPWIVEISNLNPFPWQVRVKYKGMQIESTARAVSVTFPDGERISVVGEIPCRLEHTPPLENDYQEGV